MPTSPKTDADDKARLARLAGADDAAKARAMTRVIEHLGRVVETETRLRERIRAGIALRQIEKWTSQ